MSETQVKYPQGLKWTKQRKDVYHVLLQQAEPISAAQIYELIKMQNKDSEYAVSTIYRILTAFEEKGMIIKSSVIGDETALYEWNRGEHMHYAVCLGCHKRIPLKHCPFEHVHMDSETDFEVTGHRIEVYGYCKECK